MSWRKKKKFTDQAIAYIKASNPEGELCSGGSSSAAGLGIARR
jgi:hypothetical protein